MMKLEDATTTGTRTSLTYAERCLATDNAHNDGLLLGLGAGTQSENYAARIAARAAYRAYRVLRGYSAAADMLTTPDAQPKIGKSTRYGLGLMLTPANSLPVDIAVSSGLRKSMTLCPSASAGCAAACLAYSGRGAFNKTQIARQTRAAFLLSQPFHAGVLIGYEILRAAQRYGRDGVTFRYNVLSDLRIELFAAEAFNYAAQALGVRLYDYTAHAPASRNAALIHGYSLTYSAKETTATPDDYLAALLLAGHNVAVPMHVKKGETLPDTYTFAGHTFTVIDGDLTDDRTTDPDTGVIVGLRAKGSLGKADVSGFIRTVPVTP